MIETQFHESKAFVPESLKEQNIQNSFALDTLARDWNLTGSEMRFLSRYPLKNRVWIAWNFCHLRNFGRFPVSDLSIPPELCAWFNKITGNPVFADSSCPERGSTRSDAQSEIRTFLGFEEFDDKVISDLRSWAVEKACKGLTENVVKKQMSQLIFQWRVVFPSTASFERTFAHVWHFAVEKVFDLISEGLNKETEDRIDNLLSVRKDSRYSTIFSFKSAPRDPRPPAIREWISKYECLVGFNADSINLSCISTDLAAELARIARQYDVFALRKFRKEKRYALVACFLAECKGRILDDIVHMNDVFLTSFERHVRQSFERAILSSGKNARRSRRILVGFIGKAAPLIRSREWTTLEALGQLEEVEAAALNLETLSRLEDRGFLEHALRRHAYVSRYLGSFLTLPFEGEKGTEEIIEALKIARRLESLGRKLPKDAPMLFLRQPWKSAFKEAKPSELTRTWELGLLVEVRDKLRSGDLFLPSSMRYRRFWEMVSPDSSEWKKRIPASQEKPNLPEDFLVVKNALEGEYNKAFEIFRASLGQNSFVEIKGGRLVFHREKAAEKNKDIETLRATIEHSLPTDMPIEKLLEEVDRHVDFTGKLISNSREGSKWKNKRHILRAAILAQATNIGITGMARSTSGMTPSNLSEAIRDCLGKDAIEIAIHRMVEFHSKLAFSKHYGSGNVSSSDGQRFAVRSTSVETAFCTRYFGFYKQALSVYTHVADTYSVFSTQVLSCGLREAIAVLDGLLTAESTIAPEIHTTDTHGYTDQMFALTHLLGITFAPRLKDLGDAVLYRLTRNQDLGELKDAFSGYVDLDSIAPHWPDMTRVITALKNGHVRAMDILPKLGTGHHIDGLSKAFNTMGKTVKTIFILRYMACPEFRSLIRTQLNKGEHRHALADHIFFANKGEFRHGDIDSLMCQASSLSLVCNAILIWNTMTFERIVAQLKTSGFSVNEENLNHISPLAFKHITINGHYEFEKDGTDEDELS